MSFREAHKVTIWRRERGGQKEARRRGTHGALGVGRTSRCLDGKSEPHERVAALKEKHRKLRANIDAAYDDKLNGKIAEDFWLRRTNVWQEEIAKVAAEINDLQTATFDSFAQAEEGETLLLAPIVNDVGEDAGIILRRH